jgi:hypothetical protein
MPGPWPTPYVEEERPLCYDAFFVQACLETPVELARIGRRNSSERMAKPTYVDKVGCEIAATT